MASISAEEAQSSYSRQAAGGGGFPMTELARPSGADSHSRPQRAADRSAALDAGPESTAELLQRELELFAQDDEEEGSSLIKTDYQESDAFMDYQQPQGENRRASN